MRRQIALAGRVVVALVVLCGATCGWPAQQESAKADELPPVAKPGRAFTPHPSFPKVKADQQTGLAPMMPLESHKKCWQLERRIIGGNLKDAEKACKELCSKFGNYRYSNDPFKTMYAKSAYSIVWEDGYWQMARRYRRKGLPEKAIPLERELVKWGSADNYPRFAAERLQKGLKIRATLDIPAGPHAPDAKILATVTLQNDNPTTVRTRFNVETAKGFDRTYSHEKGRWIPISHKGAHLYCSPEYDVTVAPKGTWKQRILITAHSLEHTGSYPLRITTECVTSKSNTSVLRYAD
jgi:hypothetical protein